jgi:hypothetical protein
MAQTRSSARQKASRVPVYTEHNSSSTDEAELEYKDEKPARRKRVRAGDVEQDVVDDESVTMCNTPAVLR